MSSAYDNLNEEEEEEEVVVEDEDEVDNSQASANTAARVMEAEEPAFEDLISPTSSQPPSAGGRGAGKAVPYGRNMAPTNGRNFVFPIYNIDQMLSEGITTKLGELVARNQPTTLKELQLLKRDLKTMEMKAGRRKAVFREELQKINTKFPPPLTQKKDTTPRAADTTASKLKKRKKLIEDFFPKFEDLEAEKKRKREAVAAEIIEQTDELAQRKKFKQEHGVADTESTRPVTMVSSASQEATVEAGSKLKKRRRANNIVDDDDYEDFEEESRRRDEEDINVVDDDGDYYDEDFVEDKARIGAEDEDSYDSQSSAASYVKGRGTYKKNKLHTARRQKKEKEEEAAAVPGTVGRRRRKRRGAESDEDLFFDEDELEMDKAGRASSLRDTPGQKFWNYIDSYFQYITEDHLKLLTPEVLNESDTAFEVPPLGRHYSERWAEEDGVPVTPSRPTSRLQRLFGSSEGDTANAETNGNGTADADHSKMNNEGGSESAELDVETVSDTYDDHSLSGRILSALLEENIIPSTPTIEPTRKKPGPKRKFPKKEEAVGTPTSQQDETPTTPVTPVTTEPSKLPRSETPTPQPTSVKSQDYSIVEMLSLEQRLVRELINIGVLTEEDQLPDNEHREDDEICAMLRDLQNSLREQVYINNIRKTRMAEIVRAQLEDEARKQKLEAANNQVYKAFRQFVENKKKTKGKGRGKQKETNKDKAKKVMAERDAILAQINQANALAAKAAASSSTSSSAAPSSSSSSSAPAAQRRPRPSLLDVTGDINGEISRIQEWLTKTKYPSKGKASTTTTNTGGNVTIAGDASTKMPRAFMKEVEEKLRTLRAILRVASDVQRELAQDLITQIEKTFVASRLPAGTIITTPMAPMQQSLKIRTPTPTPIPTTTMTTMTTVPTISTTATTATTTIPMSTTTTTKQQSDDGEEEEIDFSTATGRAVASSSSTAT